MDRTRSTKTAARFVPFGLCLLTLGASAGCFPRLLATGVYLWEGGNLADAECEELDGQRVVIFCRPPASNEYRHAGASRQLAERIGALLEINGAGIEVVERREVDNWTDENGLDDPKEMARALQADRLLEVEVNQFDLYNGKTLYQGNADLLVTVYDIKNNGRRLWDKPMGELLFPRNGIPAQDKSIKQFQREFIDIIAEAVARNFYRHDPTADFAIDALANK